MCCMYTVYGGMQEWVIQIPSIPILVSVLFPSLHLKNKIFVTSEYRGYLVIFGTKSSLYPFRLVKISLHVLSFLVASSDSLLRDATRWLLANAHSSVYDNPFDPSCRRSTPSHPSLSLPFIATKKNNKKKKKSMKANFKGSSKHTFKS